MVMPESRFFYSHHGQQYGPITGQQLKQLAAQGHVAPEDHVWREGGTRRFVARDLKGLFPATTRQAPSGSAPSTLGTDESRPPEAEVVGDAEYVPCPHCQNFIITDPNLAGQTVQCPHCNNTMKLPGHSQASSQPSPTAPPSPASVFAQPATEPLQEEDSKDSNEFLPDYQSPRPRRQGASRKPPLLEHHAWVAMSGGGLLFFVLLFLSATLGNAPEGNARNVILGLICLLMLALIVACGVLFCGIRLACQRCHGAFGRAMYDRPHIGTKASIAPERQAYFCRCRYCGCETEHSSIWDALWGTPCTRESKTTPGGSVCCPKCGCTSITPAKKGFEAGTGCLGLLLFGPLGLLCGLCSANQMYSVCMKCGHKWEIG
jgi:hypothetical protein